MSKPALGRGLGKLLKDTKSDPATGTAPGDANPAAGEPPETGRLSPGMASLLRKPASEESPSVPSTDAAPVEAPRPQPSSPQSNRLLRISLVTADVLLLALTAHLVVKSPGRLGFIEIILCVVAIVIGGWLTCMALWRE